MLSHAFPSCPWLLAPPAACTVSSRAFFYTTQYFEKHKIVNLQNTLDSSYYKREAFYNGIKCRVGLVLDKAAAVRANLNLDGSPIREHIHNPPTALPFASSPLHSPITFPPRQDKKLGVRVALQHQR